MPWKRGWLNGIYTDGSIQFRIVTICVGQGGVIIFDRPLRVATVFDGGSVIKPGRYTIYSKQFARLGDSAKILEPHEAEPFANAFVTATHQIDRATVTVE